MAERGWGSPSSYPLPTTDTFFDWGWGEPTPGTFDPSVEDELDAGWGHHFSVPAPVVVPPLGALAGPLTFPDEGGVVIALEGVWAISGPYRIRLVDADGGLHPAADYVYSGVWGQGTDLYADQALERVEFVLPPLPPGHYDVLVEWGPAWSLSATAAQAFRVVRRDRPHETYRVRKRLPYTGTGPAALTVEPKLRGGT